MEKKSISKIIITVGISAVVSVFLTLLAVYIHFKNLPVPLENIIKASKIIESSFVGEFNPEKAEKDMINAMVGGIDDKYAVYYDEDSARDLMQMIDGYYIGIGVEVFANPENNKIEVISAYKGTPAHRAGLRKGDCIVKIDGKQYSAKTLAEAVVFMKGANEKKPLEKELRLTVERNGETIECKLKREKIDLYKVESEIIDGICYIRYSGFTQQATEDVEKIVNSLENVEGIIIDVRDNPGGELGSAIKMCDLFLDDDMVMYTVDKNGKKKEYFAEKGKCDLPLAVIVNGSSASASEVFAGSMKANDRAVIVGEKTYGKGVTQTVQYINPYDSSSGAIKITTHKNYTPDGKWINDAITPDINVACSEEVSIISDDSAYQAAVNSIKKDKKK